MGHMKQKYKFPCGYECEFEMTMGIFDTFKVEGILEECPLHGKECPNKKKLTKNEKK